MEDIDEKIATLGLTYTAEFIPQKFSRNAASDRPSINWRVIISKDNNYLTTDYMQGIGNIPTIPNSKSKQLQRTNEVMASTMGKYRKGEHSMDYPLPKPELKDILYSLTMNSDVCNFCDFEDWAECFGYSPDSIKDKAVYESCQVIAKQFKKLVNLSEMQELFENY